MSQDLREEFKKLARNLIDTFGRDLGVTLTYDEQSVNYLDGFITRNKGASKEKTDGQYGSLVQVIGSFLGECIIANYGGQWKQSENGEWGVYFENGNAAFPFVKVQKAFAEVGEYDSIASFYRISKLFQEGKMGEKLKPK